LGVIYLQKDTTTIIKIIVSTQASEFVKGEKVPSLAKRGGGRFCDAGQFNF
jgi:hypothetical protein